MNKIKAVGSFDLSFRRNGHLPLQFCSPTRQTYYMEIEKTCKSCCLSKEIGLFWFQKRVQVQGNLLENLKGLIFWQLSP